MSRSQQSKKANTCLTHACPGATPQGEAQTTVDRRPALSPPTARPASIRQELPDRGRDAHYWAPPAQNRTCGFPAYGSHLGCLTANRALGQG
jgi:hypothetical protein